MMYQDNNTTVPKSETWTANSYRKSETWTASSYQCCTNRLPCGVCRLMQMPCPLGVHSYPDISWTDFNKVTCKETGNLTTTLQNLSKGSQEVQE